MLLLYWVKFKLQVKLKLKTNMEQYSTLPPIALLGKFPGTERQLISQPILHILASSCIKFEYHTCGWGDGEIQTQSNSWVHQVSPGSLAMTTVIISEKALCSYHADKPTVTSLDTRWCCANNLIFPW